MERIADPKQGCFEILNLNSKKKKIKDGEVIWDVDPASNDYWITQKWGYKYSEGALKTFKWNNDRKYPWSQERDRHLWLGHKK